MKCYSRSHLSDQTLLCDVTAHHAQHRTATAELLADLAEIDVRRLFLSAGYPSMYAYCVQELHMSEDAAFKRIRVARAAREFPALFAALADGRLNLNAVVLLTPHLTRENVDELVAAASHQTRSEIERLLAERFPRPDVPARVQTLAPPRELLSPGTPVSVPADPQLAARPVESPQPRPRVAPIAPERYALQLTIDQRTHDQLRYAQALLSHQVPNGDLAQVLDRVLNLAIRQLEKQKFAATSQPRRPRQSTRSARHVPAHVKRAVWERDGGRCTFVSESGHRCPARTLLEFDHIDPVARGGRATVAGMRLRCRAHNQYAAECAFGTEFMSRMREEARRAATESRQAAAKERAARERAQKEQANEVIPWLRALGFRADEARRAAARCESVPHAPLEERVRIALSSFGPRAASGGRVSPASAAWGP